MQILAEGLPNMKSQNYTDSPIYKRYPREAYPLKIQSLFLEKQKYKPK